MCGKIYLDVYCNISNTYVIKAKHIYLKNHLISVLNL